MTPQTRSAAVAADMQSTARLYHRARFGSIYHGDSLSLLSDVVAPASVDLIMTSPPFGLVRKEDHGNAEADEYLDWLRPFGEALRPIPRPIQFPVLYDGD
ncbi:MAG TPA: hypothetical protein VKX49_04710 [Bryobacteraceae bacterium]|nr:hypothetical protein [Bryobacteraceae bacterium]